MWISRNFVSLHPEYIVYVLNKIRTSNYNLNINMKFLKVLTVLLLNILMLNVAYAQDKQPAGVRMEVAEAETDNGDYSIFTYKECKVSFAIFSFDKNYKKDNCDYILYKLDSQKDEEFIQIIQKIKNSNSYQKCELLKRNIFSKEDSIINGLTIYYLKKSLF